MRTTTLDFIDFRAAFDTSDPKDGIKEDTITRLAFFNGGVGRAEASATGGSLDADQRGDVVECWDQNINRTYVDYKVTDNSSQVARYEEGMLSDCGPWFRGTLDSLDIPTFDDLDQDLLDGMEHVANHGIGDDA